MTSVQTPVHPAIAAPPRRERRHWLWIVVILLTLIGLAAATRRALVLIHPAPASQNTITKNPAAQLDSGFLQHDLRTFAHIVPAAIYLLLLPLQFIRRIRARHPRFHRWNGRLLVVPGIVVAISALALSRTNSVGGISETAATTFYALLLLWFLIAGFRSARRRDFSTHRQWMLRAYGVTLGIATTRRACI